MSKLNRMLSYVFLFAVASAFILGEFNARGLLTQEALDDALSGLPDLTASSTDVSDMPAVGATPSLLDNAVLTVLPEAVELLKAHEGVSLTAYPEGGIWLIGYGYRGPEIHKGMVISHREAGIYLEQELAERGAFVKSIVTVPMTRHEYSALVILSHNIGNGALRDSTVIQRLNAGDKKGAADAFLMWNKIKRDGELAESPALTKRRQQERALFLNGH